MVLLQLSYRCICKWYTIWEKVRLFLKMHEYHILNERQLSLVCWYAVSEYLNDREQDLRCRGAQGHECEVGHSLIPDPHSCHCRFTIRFGDGHLLLLQGQIFEKMSIMLMCFHYCHQCQMRFIIHYLPDWFLLDIQFEGSHGNRIIFRTISWILRFSWISGRAKILSSSTVWSPTLYEM